MDILNEALINLSLKIKNKKQKPRRFNRKLSSRPPKVFQTSHPSCLTLQDLISDDYEWLSTLQGRRLFNSRVYWRFSVLVVSCKKTNKLI